MVHLLPTDNIYYKRTSVEDYWLLEGYNQVINNWWNCARSTRYFLKEKSICPEQNGEGEGRGTWRFKSRRNAELNCQRILAWKRKLYKYRAGLAQTVQRLATGRTTRGSGSWSHGRVKNFHFSISSIPALGFTQPPIKWVPGALSRG
jgi:hypothetical protein